jgi:hypothetical protein
MVALLTVAQSEEKKRTARHQDSPLDNDELLATIFQAVGKREHVFVAAVSSRWSSRYLLKDSEHSRGTSYKSVLATASTLQYALSAGLTVERLQTWCKTWEHDICSSSEPIAVLQVARAQGLKWSSELCVEAVRSNNLELLQWLYDEGCLWPERLLVLTAAKHAGTPLLHWLVSFTEPELWSGRPLRRLLDHAAAAGNVKPFTLFKRSCPRSLISMILFCIGKEKKSHRRKNTVTEVTCHCTTAANEAVTQVHACRSLLQHKRDAS